MQGFLAQPEGQEGRAEVVRALQAAAQLSTWALGQPISEPKPHQGFFHQGRAGLQDEAKWKVVDLCLHLPSAVPIEKTLYIANKILLDEPLGQVENK